jgi:hypothetical protein
MHAAIKLCKSPWKYGANHVIFTTCLLTSMPQASCTVAGLQQLSIADSVCELVLNQRLVVERCHQLAAGTSGWGSHEPGAAVHQQPEGAEAEGAAWLHHKVR